MSQKRSFCALVKFYFELPSQKSGMWFFLYVLCMFFCQKYIVLHVFGNGWDQCMFYVCFMIGTHSLIYDWFPLTAY